MALHNATHGAGITQPACVDAAESAGALHVAAAATATEPVEARVMVSQVASDEDVALIGLELWVR